MERSALPVGERILLTGVTGQVGGELLEALKPLGEVVAPTRSQMDLSNSSSVREMIRTVRPRWIVNPGAYTAVDKAESEPELAYAINAEAVAQTTRVAKSLTSTGLQPRNRLAIYVLWYHLHLIGALAPATKQPGRKRRRRRIGAPDAPCYR